MTAPEPLDYAAIASYMPRAFCIELRDARFDCPDEGPGVPSFSKDGFPVFMHEVAHLVQDRSTFRGVIDFLDLWDRVSAVAAYVRRCGSNVVVPIVGSHGGSRLPPEFHWAQECEMLRGYREPREQWESEDKYWAYQDYAVENCEVTLAGRQITYPRVTVQLVDNATGEQYQHELGARELKEAHSVAVGLLHGGKQKLFGVSQFEYLVVERILSYFFGQVAPLQTVAICHWALQDLSPGNTFFAIVEHYADAGDPLPEASDIYDMARAEAIGRGFERNVHDILDNLLQYERGHGSREPNLGKLFRWYREHAEALLRVHLDQQRRFPLDTFLCEETASLENGERDAGLRQLFLELEVPLIIWPDGRFYSVSACRDETVAPVFLNRAVFDLLSRIWAGRQSSWPCPLHEGCTLAIRDDTDCLVRPWDKSKTSPTCPYGAAARLMAFEDEAYVRVEPL